MGPDGAFMACALSGHGTMAACVTGELVADWVAGTTPDASYARSFTAERFTNPALGPAVGEESGLL